jgi:hypothetical protein
MSMNKQQLAYISKKKKNRDITLADIHPLMDLYQLRGMTNEDAIAELQRDISMTINTRYQVKFFKVNSSLFSSNGWVEIDADFEAFVPGEPEILIPSARIICKRGDNI